MRVVVQEYELDWPECFEREAKELTAVFGPQAVGVVHIGSTSVPGLAAKPVIDIMAVVREIGAVDALRGAMERRGYEAMGEYGIAGRRYFRKRAALREPGVHVHAFAAGSEDALRHLAFRDFLRSRPDIASAYGRLKCDLARRFPEDIEAYMDGKDAFIKETERAALAWWAQVPLVVLSGPVGVGKTTVADALSELLIAQDISHAVADLDALSNIYPRSPGDRFGTSFALANLAALWRNARSTGARCLIAPRVIEEERELFDIAAAVPGARPALVRLRAPLPVLEERLHRRERGDSLAWHLARAGELAQQLDRTGPADIVLEAGARSPQEIAQDVLARTDLLASLR